ncbi:MAG: GtrA family protein [Patescibacteria group bacterium]
MLLKNIIKLILRIWWHKRITKYHQFFKFCVVGTIGAIIDIGGLYILVEFVHIYYLLAAVISFIVAVTNSYFLNKYWTFQNKSNNHAKQFIGFLLVSIAGLIINLAVMYALVERMAIWYLLSKAIASIVVLFWNFFMNKYVTFKQYD